MKFTNLFTIVLVILLSSGCASITKGTWDSVQVKIANCGESIQCEATNKKGTWEFDAPGSVRFKKSDDALRISCKDGDKFVYKTVSPIQDSMIWGNILVGGIIGAGVDASSDAHYDFPESVTINRETCRNESISTNN